MLQFRVWFEEQVPEEAIKVALPKVRMQRSGACGAQAFRAICHYYNVGPEDEKEFMNLLHSTKEGTWPENIIKQAKTMGFQVRYKTGMEIKELIGFLKKKIPVICAMQAWGDQKKYNKTDNSGHYVVAIGFDKENIYFEDSSINGGKRGYLSYEEFSKRWHDTDAHGHDCTRLGIAMWMDGADPDKKITKAKHIE